MTKPKTDDAPVRERMDSGFHTGQLNEGFVDEIGELIQKEKAGLEGEGDEEAEAEAEAEPSDAES